MRRTELLIVASFGLAASGCASEALSTQTAEQRIVGETDSGLLMEGVVAQDEAHLYQLTLPEDVDGDGADVVIEMTGDGDADLYTNFIVTPSDESFACRPYREGSDETCLHVQQDDQTLYVMVRGWEPASAYQLMASSTDGPIVADGIGTSPACIGVGCVQE